MIGLDFKAAKEGFFDRDKVLKAVGRAQAKVFNDAGRLIRKIAQKSIAYSKEISSPGSPPHAHRTNTIRRVSKSTGRVRIRAVSFLREYLFYSYDSASKSVVVGPARLGNTMAPESLPALEYGGTSHVKERGATRLVQIRPRPFMGPALEQAKPELPAMWRDSVR